MCLILSVAYIIYHNPKTFLLGIAHHYHVPLQFEEAQWISPHSLKLKTIEFGEIAKIKGAEIEWDWMELGTKQVIKKIVVDSPEIWTSEWIKFLEDKIGTQENIAPPSPVEFHFILWTFKFNPVVRILELRKAILNIDRLHPQLPPIPLLLGYKETPLILSNVPLLDIARHNEILEQATGGNIVLLSPYDPLSKILEIESIKVKFSWSGLVHHRVEEITIVHPTLFIGPDLFWYVDQFRELQRQIKAKGKTENILEEWYIKNLQLRYGKLTITAFGEPSFELPFIFETTAHDFPLNNWKEVSLKNLIRVVPGRVDYPQLGLSMDVAGGEIAFNLPPESQTANNLVHSVRLKEINWKGFSATDGWLSITFQKEAIHGFYGFSLFDGYTHGGFQVEFERGFPWEGWLTVSGSKMDSLIEKLCMGKKDIVFRGNIDGRLRMKATGSYLENLEGFFLLSSPGYMDIKDMAFLTKNIPPSWNKTASQLFALLADSFRNYSFKNGFIKLNYSYPKSDLLLGLYGPQGKRNFSIHWIQDPKLGPPIGRNFYNTSEKTIFFQP
ncbi:hypothetical protein IT6_10090 [Methylacidiphilum caldifontis]|uniref:AsmA-like C-terminal domain-containing protein n=1 Tax=Methylacidiphilum caldifontis TaxID=2795386 RepID=A0A4Y8PHE4_9BACT|nr:hypothetical protein IT6_10090 [Methylacidiphilum caldifontis]TFE73317.1 hypothetical protein A7Q10_03285 [Methylacidiphilum caldifontis]